MKSIIIKDFSLKHTLESGQFFMFELIVEFYYVITPDLAFKIKQDGDKLFFDGIDEKALIYFFSLDEDLEEQTKDFKEDKHLAYALEKYWGLRLIKQDLWQCMISFVCSSASNIPKIKKNLKLISEFFGEKIIFDGKEFYLFPKPGITNDIDKLKNAKTGYRAQYIYEINKIVTKNSQVLDDIKASDYITSKKILMSFPGIGSKVADCICLFALGHIEAFPIDTWIKQILEELYLEKQTKNIKEIEKYIQEHFKGHRGLKQQYLYHYKRNG